MIKRRKLAFGGPGDSIGPQYAWLNKLRQVTPGAAPAVAGTPVIAGSVPATDNISFTPTGGTPLETTGGTSAFEYTPLNSAYGNSASTTQRRGIDWNGVGQKAGQIGNDLAPYVSNIVNSFRRAPAPSLPEMNSPVSLKKVNLNGERYKLSRSISAANAGASRMVPANTAAAIAASNLGTEINGMSDISTRETMANTQIQNQETLTNANIAAGNTNTKNEYGQSMTERNIAEQRTQSANLANAADKYMAIKNEAAKAKLDKDKTRILSTMYNQSGVYKRLGKQWKDQGLEDPLGMNYSWVDEKRYGGKIRKSVY